MIRMRLMLLSLTGLSGISLRQMSYQRPSPRKLPSKSPSLPCKAKTTSERSDIPVLVRLAESRNDISSVSMVWTGCWICRQEPRSQIWRRQCKAMCCKRARPWQPIGGNPKRSRMRPHWPGRINRKADSSHFKADLWGLHPSPARLSMRIRPH